MRWRISALHLGNPPIDFPRISKNADTYLHIARKTENIISRFSPPNDSRMLEKLERSLQPVRGASRFTQQSGALLRPSQCNDSVWLLRSQLPFCNGTAAGGIEPKAGRLRCQLKNYWRPVPTSNTIFILGHSGALQFDAGLELAQTYDNVWLEVSSRSNERTPRHHRGATRSDYISVPTGPSITRQRS